MSEKDTQRKQTFISRRILSWCGDHKMKVIAIAILLALASLSGGYWYQEQQENAECGLISLVSVFSPVKIEADRGTSVLNIEIDPKQDFTDPIIIDIIPKNFTVMKVEQEGLQNLGNRYRYTVPQEKRYKDHKFVTTFDVTATCNCNSGSWDVDIEVVIGGSCTTKRTVQFIVQPTPPDNDGGLGMESILSICGILIVATFKRRTQKKK